MPAKNNKSVIPAELIEKTIFFIRGEKVMLDVDLAELYGVTTSRLIEAVKRNINRFPKDFMFQLTNKEAETLRSQFAISNEEESERSQVVAGFRSQIVTSKGRGGRRYKPYVFTEQGIAMLSSVLNSERAISVNIEIMRTFVRLHQMISSHAELRRKLDALESKYDVQFRIVFDAIRELMAAPIPKSKQRIGFHES